MTGLVVGKSNSTSVQICAGVAASAEQPFPAPASPARNAHICAMYFPAGAHAGSEQGIEPPPAFELHFLSVKMRPFSHVFVAPVLGTGLGCGQFPGQPTGSHAPHAATQDVSICTGVLSAR